MSDTQHPRATEAANRSIRFLFDNADSRGETVHLDSAYREVLAIHQYAPAVGRLLGEFMAAAVLLSTTLKFDGKLILQARSEGQIPLLMVECNSALEIRAIARGADQATAEGFHQLLANGQLAITVDPDQGQRYQGIVPLAGDSLAHSLDAYFSSSEQLGTRLWLAADDQRAGGLLAEQRQQQWEHACTMAETVRDTELLEMDTQQLLQLLYREEPVRLYEPLAVAFRCSCSRERTLNALSSINPAEIEELLEELGCITMDCEFCNQQYRFSREDLAAAQESEGARTLH
jgi:molecular chaperone Hsp33